MELDVPHNAGVIRATDLARLFSPAQIRSAVRGGALVRVRRGSYVDPAIWSTLTDAQKHVVLMRAMAADATSPPVFAADSAGVLWGLADGRGTPFVTVLSEPQAGGRSHAGIRRLTRRAVMTEPLIRHGLRCTGLARTALDMAAARPFPRAVAVLDIARRRGVEPSALAGELVVSDWPRHVRRAVELSTPLSDSPGESEARAVIHLRGFAAPELQREFRDRDGVMRVDFFWPEQGVVGEFDGKAKYTRDEFTAGDPSAVVWREKRREDRLRRQIREVVRFSTAEVRDPPRLRRLLLEAGVPCG